MKSKQLYSQVRRTLGLTSLGVLTAGFLSASVAADSGTAPAAKADMSNITVINVSRPAKMRALSAGQRVYIDPVTKEIREPTLEDIHGAAAEDNANNKSFKAQSVAAFIPAKAGALGARLSPEYHSYTVVTRNDDGTLAEVCVTGQDAAEKALASGNTKSRHSHKGAAHESK